MTKTPFNLHIIQMSEIILLAIVDNVQGYTIHGSLYELDYYAEGRDSEGNQPFVYRNSQNSSSTLDREEARKLLDFTVALKGVWDEQFCFSDTPFSLEEIADIKEYLAKDFQVISRAFCLKLKNEDEK